MPDLALQARRRAIPTVRTLAACLALALAACGGGGGSGGASQRVVVGDGYDLWSAPLDGSGLVALADSPDQEWAARTVGDWVIYSRQAGGRWTLWAVRRDGTGRQQLGGDNSYFLGVEAGRAIVQVHGNETTPARILAVPLDGGASITLGEAAGLPPASLQGKVLGGRVFVTTFAGPNGEGPGQLAVVRPDGTGRTVLLDAPAFAMSATGAAVLASANDTTTGWVLPHLHLATLDGATRHDVGLVGAMNSGVQAFGYESAFEPVLDGDLAWLHCWDPATTTGALLLLNLVTGELQPVVDGLPDKPDPFTVLGGRLVFYLDGELASAGQGAAGVTPFPQYGYGSSFAGELGGRVLYLRRTSSSWSDVDLVSALPDGTGATTVGLAVLTQVGHGDLWSDLARRPAAVVGDRVLFRQAIAGQDELVSTKVDGTSRVILGPGAGAKGLEAVAGDVVIYRSISGGRGDLFAVRADGTGHVALATAAEDELLAGVVGTTVYFQRMAADGTGTLYAVPLAGGTPKALGAVPRRVSAVP